jgi:hypothetical protein
MRLNNIGHFTLVGNKLAYIIVKRQTGFNIATSMKYIASNREDQRLKKEDHYTFLY